LRIGPMWETIMKRVIATSASIFGVASVVLAVSLQPARAEQVVTPRSQVDLTGPWLFWPDKKDEGVGGGVFGERFDASSWRRTLVPVPFDH
jgi:hypothetical protein